MPAYVAMVIGPEILDNDASPVIIFHSTRSVNVDMSHVLTTAFVIASTGEYSIRVISCCLTSSGTCWYAPIKPCSPSSVLRLSGITINSFSMPSLSTINFMALFGFLRIDSTSVIHCSIAIPSTCRITSPFCRPALSAAPFSITPPSSGFNCGHHCWKPICLKISPSFSSKCISPSASLRVYSTPSAARTDICRSPPSRPWSRISSLKSLHDLTASPPTANTSSWISKPAPAARLPASVSPTIARSAVAPSMKTIQYKNMARIKLNAGPAKTMAMRLETLWLLKARLFSSSDTLASRSSSILT